MTESPISRTEAGFQYKLIILVIVSALTAFGYKAYLSSAENNSQAAQTKEHQNEEATSIAIAEETVAENNTYATESVPIQLDAVAITPSENMERQNEETLMQALVEDAKAKDERRKEYIRNRQQQMRAKFAAIKKGQAVNQNAGKADECRQSIGEYESGSDTDAGRKAWATLLYAEGIKCFNLRNYEKAKEYWTESARLDPDNDASFGLKRIESILGNNGN